MAQAYTAPDWGTGEGISPSNLQAISNTLEAIVQGADRAIHHIDIAEGNTTVTYIDGTVETYAISGLRGISSVIKRTDGAVDTYTIVYTDGTSYTFNITNGTDGNGIIGIIEIPDQTLPLNVHRYRIMFSDGTHFDYDVSDGLNGRNGQDGVGITDIRETKTDNIHTITIYMSNGAALEFEIADGINTEEAAEVIEARGEYQSLKQRLDTSDSKVLGLKEDLNQTNATLKASSTTTSTDTLDYAINGNIVSADFVGYARKSRNIADINDMELSEAGYAINDIVNLPSGTYTLSFDFKGSSIYSELYFWGGDSPNISKAVSNGKNTYTITNSGTTTKIQLYATGGGSFSNIQIEKGNTATPYEPYGDKGIIKPSGVVESSGKNLFDYTNIANWYKPSSSSVYRKDLKLKPNTAYTLSQLTDRNGSARAFIVSGKDLEFYPSTSSNGCLSTEPRTVISDANGYITIGTYNETEARQVQLEENATATPFTPYVEPSTIELPYTPLGIGEIKDELIVYADGTGKFVKRIDSVDLGGLSWSYSAGQGNERMYSSNIAGIKNNSDYYLISNILCSKYNTVNFSSIMSHSVDNSICVRGLAVHAYSTSMGTDADAFKTSLNGVLLYYELATPQEIALTQAQVEQILALKTFADVTYIDADGLTYELGYIINAGKAIKDLKDIIKALTSTQTLDVADNASETMSAMPSKSVKKIDLEEITEEQTEEPTE